MMSYLHAELVAAMAMRRLAGALNFKLFNESFPSLPSPSLSLILLVFFSPFSPSPELKVESRNSSFCNDSPTTTRAQCDNDTHQASYGVCRVLPLTYGELGY